MLEVAAEERIVGKIQSIGNLADGHIRGTEESLRFDNHPLPDMGHRKPSGRLADEFREVLGADTQPVGIELDGALTTTVQLKVIHKAKEDFLLSRFTFLRLAFM